MKAEESAEKMDKNCVCAVVHNSVNTAVEGGSEMSRIRSAIRVTEKTSE